MNQPLFRQEAIDAKRDRLTGTVVAATPPRAGLYAALLGGGFFILLLVVIFGQFASRAAVTGVVAYDRGIARLYPSAVAEVRAVHVREGQMVSAGQPLVTIAISPGRDAEGEGVAAQMAQIARRDRELQRQQDLTGSLGDGDTAGLVAQAANQKATIGSLERQRDIAAAQVKIAQSDAARANRLVRESAATRRQAEEAAAGVLTRRAEVESLGERILAQREALRATEVQIAQRRITTEQTVSQLTAERAELAAARSALLRLDRLELTAPVAGRVSDLIAEVGQRARPDASLVTVVPEGSNLEAWLYTPTRAAGFVAPGQEVRLLFDAFPFQKYGAGMGVVNEVSRVPTDPGAIDPGLKIDQPVFRVRIRVTRGVTGVDGQPLPLRPGMTLNANLVLERRPLVGGAAGPRAARGPVMSGGFEFPWAQRIAPVLQSEAAECGLACLTMIAKAHGHRVNLGGMRRMHAASMKGATLTELVAIADAMDLGPRPLRLDLDELPQLKLPAILHWGLDHFVVLEKVDARGATIVDPAVGRRQIGRKALSDNFTGVALECQPTAAFVPQQALVKVRLSDLYSRLTNYGPAIAQVVGLSLLLQVTALVTPFFLQITIDEAIAQGDTSLILLLGIGFGVVFLLGALVEALRSWVVLALGESLSFQLAGNVVRHLLRLPLAYFERRHVGDLMSRLGSIEPIEKLLSQGMVNVAIDSVLALTTLIVMLMISAATDDRRAGHDARVLRAVVPAVPALATAQRGGDRRAGGRGDLPARIDAGDARDQAVRQRGAARDGLA